MACQHNSMESGKCNDCGHCKHEVIYFGLCAVCGKSVDQDEDNIANDHININHNATGIVVSLKEAERLEKEDEKRLLQAKKLSLIIDLDQTILHAAWEPHIAKWVDEHKQNDKRAKDMSTFSLDGSINKYTIKLRPGLNEFLQDMSRLYEMHIYTMGTRAYADAVTNVIDPTHSLFQDRILSRDENGSMTKKRLERLFPSDQTKVIVLDDRADVWDWSPNLIQIKPYEYFAGIGDINAPPVATDPVNIPTEDQDVNTLSDNVNENESVKDETAATKDQEEDKKPKHNNVITDITGTPKPVEIPNYSHYTPKANDPDNTLTIVQKVLEDVHQEFYNQMDIAKKPNVADILTNLKTRVLDNIGIVFSGVIPLHYRPEDSSIWRMAASFGATCFDELTGKVTHLVAANGGTTKVKTARKYTHIKIVSPAWLTHSVWNWKKQDEEPYLIPLPREKSPASEVENPEEAALDFDDGIDIDWDDDEVDAALMDDDDEDSDVDVPSDSEAEEENAPNGVAVSVDADSDAAESDYGSSLAGLDQQAEDNADSDAVESDYGSSQNGEEREEFSAGEEEEEAIQHNNTQTYTETDDDDMAGLIEDALDDIDSGSEAEYASSQVPEDEVGSDVDMINTLKRRLVEEHDDEPLERPSKKR